MRSAIFAVSTALTVLLSACTGTASSVPVNTVSSVSASTSITTSSEVDSAVSESASSETGNIQTGLVREQTLDSTEGLIHYSYYLPEDYDGLVFAAQAQPDNYADAMALDNLENVSPEGNIMDLAPLDPYASLYFSICG